MSNLILDVSKLIDYFGGVSALEQGLKDVGVDVSSAAIYKWRQRGSMPMSKLEGLLNLAKKKNLDFDINEFIQTETMEHTTMNPNRVIIFDTTLRDGEQTPGAAMTKEEKIRIALQLEKLGVDVLEVGFAAASPGDFESVNAISKLIKQATVCSLARANEKDVRKSGEALEPAAHKRIHVFIATSPLHMEFKLKKTPEEVLDAAIKSIKIAKEYTDDIEFSAEDGFRSDMDFLEKIFTAAIEAGATTINMPDTVGYSIPSHTKKRFEEIIKRVPNSDKVVWSAHCHDDLGMAVANSIAAVQGGARQIECAVNGMGERAGNASLEEVVMAIKTRQDLLELETNVDTKQILATSKLVSTITGYPVPSNKAIVGVNAFAHESGIHQDGVLKCRETYEIISPESIGWSANRLTLGKLSGRNAFKTKLQELGIFLESEEKVNAAFARFKDLADKKRQIFDEDLHALVSDEISNMGLSEDLRFISLKIDTETGESPLARIYFSEHGKEVMSEASGVGAVDSVFKAIESVINSGATLELYSVNAVTEGIESQADVTIRLKKGDKIVSGQGTDLDILNASAKAYLSALSKFQTGKEGLKIQA
ncbi:2-isopropylmalate synthase [Neisseriaceae bacterium PsAf]|nr:2-isopropylmalate synthase [Neisseriaceae bacterium PsAf]